MITEALATVATINPEKRTRSMNGNLPAPAKTVGGRFKQAFTTLPQQGLAVLGLTAGNLLANLFRSQVVARMPLEHPAALHAIDFGIQNVAIAPVLGLIPGEFGQNTMLGVRFNTVNAVGRAVVPPKYPAAKMLFGVDEFVSAKAMAEAAAALEAEAAKALEAQNAAGAMAQPGGEYRRRAVGAMAQPGAKYRRAG